MQDNTIARKIHTALISGLFQGRNRRHPRKNSSKEGVTLLSTGGTYSYLAERGFKCDKVEDLTSYPSILGGRVKTLHPKVFGGILARGTMKATAKNRKDTTSPTLTWSSSTSILSEATVAHSGAQEADIIEKIDIGGISLIRAAAKNYQDVLIVSNQGQYGGSSTCSRPKAARPT